MMSGRPGSSSSEMSGQNQPSRDASLDLRSSGAPSSTAAQVGSFTESGSRVAMETGDIGTSQQVISPPTQPSVLQPCYSGSGAVKEGLELTVPESPLPHVTLPRSQFASSSGTDNLPDDVILEKQSARERFYSDQSVDSGKTSADRFSGEYKSYPVQETTQTGGNTGQQAQGNHGNPQERSNDSFVEYPSMTSSSDLNSQRSTDSGGLNLRGVGSSFTSPSHGAQPTSAPHASSAGLPWQQNRDLTIKAEEYPDRFKEGQYDCVLIYCETDVQMALNFKDIMQKFVLLENGQSPKICILDRNDNLPWISSRFKHADEAMDRSTYMFLFVTETFVTDAWAEIQKDECLMESIREPEKKWCVVPLHTTNKRDIKFRYPYGLRALKGVDISIMLKGRTLEQVDPKKLTPDDLDTHFLENITRMFNHKLRHKLERERRQELELKKWILAEREKKATDLILQQHEMEKQRIQDEASRARLIKQSERELENVRQNVQNVKLADIDDPIKPSGGQSGTQPLPDMLRNTMAMMTGMTPEQQLMQMQILQMQMSLMQQAQGLPSQPPMAFPGMMGLPMMPGMAPQTAAHAGPAVPVYTIHNYANMQVGDSNKQTVNQTQGGEEPAALQPEEVVVVEYQDDSSSPGTKQSTEKLYESNPSKLQHANTKLSDGCKHESGIKANK